MVLAERWFGYRPLVSVRSGAPISCPGMMDTILNVGISTGNIDEWCARIGIRAALDSYRRLIQMLGATAYGVPKAAFDGALEAIKAGRRGGARRRARRGAPGQADRDFEEIFELPHQEPFPQDWTEQLRAAIRAVFDSWMNARAIEYRKMNGISEEIGTAVTVQAMVFGNMGETSGSGVLFTRNPSTGEKKIMGEYLANAQGEDVVSGIRTPDPLGKWFALALANPASNGPAQLRASARRWRSILRATWSTWSSPCRRASSSSCSPAPASAARRRRSGSRWSWSTRG